MTQWGGWGVDVRVARDRAVVVDDAPRVVQERVLIVKDDAAARAGLEQLVKSWGFMAESAGDGKEALEKSHELPARDRDYRHGDAAHGRARPSCARCSSRAPT